MGQARVATFALALAGLAVAGCGSTSHTETSQDEVMSAYGDLAQNSAAFYTAAAANTSPVESGRPTTIEELTRNVDYVFTDGVEIASYELGTGICFTGHDDTFLTIAPSPGTTVGLQRIFGTGDCSTTDGDIVIIDDIDTQDGSAPVVDEFVKGEDLASQVTGLSDFTDYLERTQQEMYSD